MSTASEHYEQLLAQHYIWMVGMPFEAKVAEQKALLAGIFGSLQPPVPLGAALDLGSGPGFQAIALAELGYSPVTAVDTSKQLLDELAHRNGIQSIEMREADLTALGSLTLPDQPSVIVCMGDTLSHLPSRSAVVEFFKTVYTTLAAGGVFVISYRDLTNERAGLDRFLLVRSDAAKILTCFIESKSEEVAIIHDLLHIREGDSWKLQKGCYAKCRLAHAWVMQALLDCGFRIEGNEQTAGMILITARRDSTSAERPA